MAGNQFAKNGRYYSMETRMNLNRKEPFVLLGGDLLALYSSLWLTLLVRYLHLPDRALIESHLAPFSLLFLVWILIFFIAGLYEKHTLLLRSKLGGIIVNAQIANSAVAFIFFYLISYFSITPKTNLFLFLCISSALVAFWRLSVVPALKTGKRESALLIGMGDEMRELEREVNGNTRYKLQFVSAFDLDNTERGSDTEEILERLRSGRIALAVVDFHNEKLTPLLPKLSAMISSNIRFVDMHKVYEDIFDRIPLSLVEYSWFLENISGVSQKGYDLLKRGTDIVISLVLGVCTLVLYPFVALAIKMEDGGPALFAQERVGQKDRRIHILKFRSMAVHTNPDGLAQNPQTTRVGRFLRATRIDELPQLWNVIKGDLSLIGPRPEVPNLASLYEQEIPYYTVRHIIKPGLSGWAQLYQDTPPKFSVQLDQTRTKLSYDLYYIKNRSLLLDMKIALRTLKILLSREGI